MTTAETAAADLLAVAEDWLTAGDADKTVAVELAPVDERGDQRIIPGRKVRGTLMPTNAQVMNSRLICAIGDWLVIAVCPRLDRTARS